MTKNVRWLSSPTNSETEAGLKGGNVVDVDEGIHGQQQPESVVKVERTESSDLGLSPRDVESINEKPLRDDEVEERVDVGDVAAVDGSTESEDFLELREVVNTDDGVFREENFQDVIVIEDLDSKEELLLGGGDVESGNQKVLANKLAEYFIDDLYTSGLAAAETGVNATIVGSGDLETILAGENLASSVVADDVLDVGNVLAVLATGGATERRSNSTTTTYNPALSIVLRAARGKNLQFSASPVTSTHL